MKPYFSNKLTRNEKITLVEENKIIITNKTVAEKLSSYFKTIVENLDLQNKAERSTDDDLGDVIRNFENHSSIIKIGAFL